METPKFKMPPEEGADIIKKKEKLEKKINNLNPVQKRVYYEWETKGFGDKYLKAIEKYNYVAFDPQTNEFYNAEYKPEKLKEMPESFEERLNTNPNIKKGFEEAVKRGNPEEYKKAIENYGYAVWDEKEKKYNQASFIAARSGEGTSGK